MGRLINLCRVRKSVLRGFAIKLCIIKESKQPFVGEATKVCLVRSTVGGLILVTVAAAAVAQSAPPTDSGPLDAGMRGHGGPVRALAVRPNGQLVSAGFDSTIIIWDLKRGEAVQVLRQHDTAVNAVLARPDGCVVSGGDDGRIKVWCETTPEPAAPPPIMTGHEGAVATLSLSPDARRLASGGSDHTVRIWDQQTGAPTGRTIAEHAGPVTSVVWATDGAAVFSASHDRTVRLSPVKNGEPARVLKLEAAASGIAVLPDGRVLLACADGALREADAALTTVRTVVQVDGPLTSIALSPGGQTAVTGGLRTPATLIDLTTGKVLPARLGNGLSAWALTYSANGAEIFSGGIDRVVRRFGRAQPGDPDRRQSGHR
jgi:cytochrome c